MEIIVIKKKRYAAGLSPWLALPSRGKAIKLASKKTKDLKGKGFCLRPSPIPQVGIANEWAFSKNGEPVKGTGFGSVYSLATAIAGNQPESWAGLFHITEKSWWVISVMNGVIVPDGDFLTEDEDSARKFYDMEVSRLSQEITPIEINDVAESIKWIEAHLSVRYVGRLQKDGVDQKQIALAGAAGLILVAGTGGYLWHEHDLSVARAKARQALLLKIRQEQLQEKKEATLKAAIRPSQKPRPRPKPWAGKPLFSDYARAVQGVFGRVPMASSGWQLTGLKCDMAVCTATYKRSVHVATFWFRPQDTLPDIATKTVSRNYPLQVSLGTQHIGKAHLSVWLMGWMQAHGIHGSVTPAAVAYQAMPYMPQRPTDNGNKTAQKFLPPTWKAMSWTISSILPPWQMTGISVVGVVPESADYNAGDGRWTITGGAYEPIK
ncbi:type 4b pilus protein PilO2 [Acidithiobacillus sp.]|uniref:type 4b pilus protein PilO2 n=1 Tax=Acidithiobacillus sp. TaxID=1872118 RepID=UPI0025C32270|nr:type 4b pilus protein PilO2 [Acidithiobacillus sp.]